MKIRESYIRVLAFAMLAALGLPGIAMSADSPPYYTEVSTPQGILSLKDSQLVLNGRPLGGSDENQRDVALATHYIYKTQTVQLLQFGNGTSCPALFQWLVITDRAVVRSPIFGTCTDVIDSKMNRSEVTVQMGGFQSNLTDGRYVFNGRTLESFETDEVTKKTKHSSEPAVVQTTVPNVSVLPPPDAPAGRPPSSAAPSSSAPAQNNGNSVPGIMQPHREINLYTIRYMRDMDVGTLVVGASMTGCPVQELPQRTLSTKSWGTLIITEYEFPNTCYASAGQLGISGAGLISDQGQTFVMSYLYVKGGREALFRYLQSK